MASVSKEIGLDVSNLLGGLTGAGATGTDPSTAVAGVQQLIDQPGGILGGR
jgi:hypothetical protein